MAEHSGRVAGKRALVTGASSGIGAAVAERLVREGARVLLSDVREDACRARAAALDAEACALDVADEDAWAATMARIADDWGGLDILVNNAGVLPEVATLEDTALDDWRRVLAVNLDGAFLGVKHAIPVMKAREHGQAAIVNIASVFGLVGAPIIGAYGASKFGVVGLSRAAALECAYLHYPIRVNAVCPGYIRTPMTEAVGHNFGFDAELGRLARASPMGRMGAPAEIAAAVLYLASDEAAFVTGTELVVDGGYHAR